MRKPPTIPAPNRDKKSDLGRIIMTRHYKVITPLFGGGVKPNKVDDETPIRGSTIRGQLRFWWRATRGGEFGGDLAKMKAAEEAIWGSTKTASCVSISVKIINKGTTFVVPKQDKEGNSLDIGDPGSIYGYVGFPLRPTEKNPTAGTIRKGIEFEITFIFPNTPQDLHDGVQAAVWAWETFGGVGARTRRGFGAVSCEFVRMDPYSSEQDTGKWFWRTDSNAAKTELRRQVRSFVSEKKVPEGVPQLSRNPLFYRIRVSDGEAARDVWEDLIGALKAFRQNRPEGDYGRSNWPEPDAIREITKEPGVTYEYDDPVYDPLIEKFPRAVFGLPIGFEFKLSKNQKNEGRSAPQKTRLVGANVNRLASPLILRPLQCSDRSVGLATLLMAPRPWHLEGGLALKEDKENGKVFPTSPRADLSEDERDKIKAKHDLYNGTPNILLSFLEIL